MKKKIKQIFGFTFVELLVVMGVFLIMALATIPVYSGMQISGQLNEADSEIVQTLRMAKEYSRSGFNNQNYGVYFEMHENMADEYVLYQGDSYALRDINFDRRYELGKSISLTVTIPGNDINFLKNSGIPNNSGEIFLFDVNNRSSKITINQYGFINAD